MKKSIISITATILIILLTQFAFGQSQPKKFIEGKQYSIKDTITLNGKKYQIIEVQFVKQGNKLVLQHYSLKQIK